MWPPDMVIIGKWFSLANIIFFKANDPLKHLWNPGGPTPSVSGGSGGTTGTGSELLPEE